MARPAAVTPDQIRTTVLAMLAEAGDAQPPSAQRFRKIVSVRKLRARLGAGDPATLSHLLNAIESEVVRAGLAEVAIPGLPEAIAEQMRALWQAAVTVQLDDVVRLRTAAAQAAEASTTARHDAELRTDMLRVELAELRAHSGREACQSIGGHAADRCARANSGSKPEGRARHVGQNRHQRDATTAGRG
jgi:hypothetical protein